MKKILATILTNFKKYDIIYIENEKVQKRKMGGIANE